MLRCRRIEVRAGGALAYTHPMVHTHAPFRGLSVGNCHTCHQVSTHRSSFQARRCTCLWKGSIFGSLGAIFHALARPADASDIPSRGESFPRTTLTYPSAYGWRFTRTQGACESKLLDRVTAPRHRFRAALFWGQIRFRDGSMETLPRSVDKREGAMCVCASRQRRVWRLLALRKGDRNNGARKIFLQPAATLDNGVLRCAREAPSGGRGLRGFLDLDQGASGDGL